MNEQPKSVFPKDAIQFTDNNEKELEESHNRFYDEGTWH